MNRIFYISGITLLLLIFSTGCCAQGIKAYKKDGSVIRIPYAKMDSMVVTDKRISDIDLKPKSYTINGYSFTMIPVEGGTFTMGAIIHENGESNIAMTPHPEVTLSDFYICEIETTWGMWDAVMQGSISGNKYDNYPVQPKSWDDAQDFISQLNAMTGEKFRLPTEAEWEYAARGGSKSQGYEYAGSNTINDVAWYKNNSNSQCHAVKGKKPNELGLYDMSGNIDEWVFDIHYSNYPQGPLFDPQGPSDDDYPVRSVRGGRMNSVTGACKVLSRTGNSQDAQYSGFRIALSAK